VGGPPRSRPEVVDRVTRDYRGGVTLQRIADALTAEGVPTAQGGRRWYGSTVRGVLERTQEPRRRRGPRGRCKEPDTS
jgi:hypothetical protein